MPSSALDGLSSHQAGELELGGPSVPLVAMRWWQRSIGMMIGLSVDTAEKAR